MSCPILFGPLVLIGGFYNLIGAFSQSDRISEGASLINLIIGAGGILLGGGICLHSLFGMF